MYYQCILYTMYYERYDTVVGQYTKLDEIFGRGGASRPDICDETVSAESRDSESLSDACNDVNSIRSRAGCGNGS